jgi:predicted negative regulator of RcsB-dependent stress response
MVARLRRKDLKKDEFVETVFDFGQWLEENWPVVVRYASAIALIVVVALAWWWYVGYNRDKAEELLAQGMQKYTAAESAGFAIPEEVEEALALFEESNDKGSSTPAGRTALYYKGASLYRLGRLDEAIPVLEEVSSSEEPATLVGVAGSMLADALVDAGQPDRALAVLEEMAAAEEPTYPADLTLLKVAGIHQAAGDIEAAQRVWQRITEEHPQTPGAIEASRLLNNPG